MAPVMRSAQLVSTLSARTGLANLVGPRRQRRVWSQDGRAYIEVRGITAGGPRPRQALETALRRLDGVLEVETNVVTGEAVVAFDEEHLGLSLDLMVETVEEVEEALGVRDESLPGQGHPADPEPLTAETLALMADGVAIAVATAGRVVRLPRVHRGARLLFSVLDNQPRLRRQVEARLGPYGTDFVLAMGNAVVHGLTQEPTMLVVDGLHRMLQVAELRERRAAWSRREPEIAAGGLPAQAPERRDRPCPLPAGPLESYDDRAALAALVGTGGILALTRDPGTAADLLLAAVPRAARLGREGFAAMLDRLLARQGVVTMDTRAYRRMERLSAVVFDAAVFCDDGVQILGARGHGSVDDREVWRAAVRLLADDPEIRGLPDAEGRRLKRLAGGSPGDPRGLRARVSAPDGDPLGEVLIGCGIHPLADATLTAARVSDLKVLVTGHASIAELISQADATLEVTEPLAEHVRRLQADGHGVLLVGGDEAAALAADVSLSVIREGRPALWGADLICGPGLEQVWRLLAAVGTAREATRRGVRLAFGGSTLGSLMAVTGRRTPAALSFAPVHTAALIALVGGAVSGHRAAVRPCPPPTPRLAWYAMDAQTALRRARRLAAVHGAPRAPGRRLPRPARAVAELARAVEYELRDPLTPVLVLGAAASAIVGSGIDAALVGGVMVGNAMIGGVQRTRAEHALRHLLVEQHALGRRLCADQSPLLEHRPESELVDASKLRIGDIIALEPSDVVPADARLLDTDDLEVDESSLTGESVPVAKSTVSTPGAELVDRTCMVHEGTTVLAGRALAVVVATGDATEAGRAAAMAGPAVAAAGVQAQLNELTRVSLPATAVGGALVSALSFARGVQVREAVSSGIAVAIAAVPEGLPLVATVAQLAAARRLSRRDVLVRSSRTLGALGRVDTLCFDKTGTLTEGKLTLTRLSSPTEDVEATSPTGHRLLVTASRTCPRGRPARHATDRAVAEAARPYVGADPGWKLLHETQFTATRGYSSATGTEDGMLQVAVKGSPETTLSRCARVVVGDGTRPLTKARREAAWATVRRLAADGLRVLAVAEARVPQEDRAEDLAEVEKLGETAELVLLGFVGIADTARPEAPETIDRLTRAGIRVVMITGDHPDTARAVAAGLRIPDPDRILTGAELDRLSDQERTDRIAGTSVFARVSPEHKVRIVQALQRAGGIVAMAGDGSNDAAAIRLADVGIGMAAGDSRAARSAADIVLPGTDLPAIVEAMAEGRALWDSVRNAASILVGGNAGEVAFTIFGTAVGGRAPLTTRQLLLVNTLTDMLPALAVALAAPDQESPETRPRQTLFGDALATAIATRGAVTALGAVLAWQSGRFTGRRRRADTMALAALVMTQLAQTLQTAWRSRTVLGTVALSALVLAAVIETPGISQFFECTPLGPVAWTMVLTAAGAATLTSMLLPRLGRLLPAPQQEGARVEEARIEEAGPEGARTEGEGDG
ncbi:HAD-IC family P-type ATPase [Actinomadura scrupuli]|uniref:HAD-IC family P-type ATPase n=1 Tax=Actinomadura scrupuli TaxID=559629 RepID=UPI003D99104F